MGQFITLSLSSALCLPLGFQSCRSKTQELGALLGGNNQLRARIDLKDCIAALQVS